MDVLLDTNFSISCIIKRIDFIEELESLGFKIKVPRGVLQEMKDLRKEDKTTHKERQAIDAASTLLRESKIKIVKVGGRYVDEGLIQKGKQGIYIATLDREIKNQVPNKVVIDSARKSIKIERD
ncbi:MAG: hypothetical protein KC506_03315 [Nanoarchaeota archaeon]|nr:hypothetical protein [Nanoarchaeota archaeon]